jgi:hypothetical protein
MSNAVGEAGRPEGATLSIIRGGLLIVLLVGLVGVLGELLLLEHVEDPWQRVPVFLLVAALIIVTWHGFDRGPLSIRVLQGTMILFVLAGAVGLLLHLKGNMEFELEMKPAMGGWTLLRESLMGATPALAPGTMVQLGLIGLVYTYRHPKLRRTGPPYSTRHDH